MVGPPQPKCNLRACHLHWWQQQLRAARPGALSPRLKCCGRGCSDRPAFSNPAEPVCCSRASSAGRRSPCRCASAQREAGLRRRAEPAQHSLMPGRRAEREAAGRQERRRRCFSRGDFHKASAPDLPYHDGGVLCIAEVRACPGNGDTSDGAERRPD